MSATDTMTEAEFDAAVRAAIDELRQPNPDEEDRLTDAGVFVARFGPLGELFEEPGLSQLQFDAHQEDHTAWNLIGHWSVERNDGGTIPEGFDAHQDDCHVCDYLEGVLGIVDIFQHEMCETCGLDLEFHDVAPDHNGDPVAHCRSVWERREPLAAPAGDAAEYQIGDAFGARWTAPLTDGTFALVSRTYYLGQYEEGQVHIQGVNPGEVFVERQDEYLVCTDLDDPGGTEINAEYRYEIVESDDPADEDPEALALESFEPEPGEWEQHAPEWARELIKGACA